MAQEITNKSIRGLKRHVKNPFIISASNNKKGGVKRISTGKDRLMVVNKNTGECLGGLFFFNIRKWIKYNF